MDFVAPTAATVAQTGHHAAWMEPDLTAGETIPMTPVGPKTGFARGGLGASESLTFDDDGSSGTSISCRPTCMCKDPRKVHNHFRFSRANFLVSGGLVAIAYF